MASISFEIQRQRWRLSALKVQMALLRCGLLLKTFNPNQPRVPAGEPDGGQWTKEGEGAQDSTQDNDKIIFAAEHDDRRYSVDLRKEERSGSHAIKSMWGKQT